MSYVKSFIRGIFRRRKAYWNDGISAAARAAGLADGVGGAGATAGGQVGGNPVEATLAVVIEVHGIRRSAAVGKGALDRRPVRWGGRLPYGALRVFYIVFSWLGVVAGSIVAAKGTLGSRPVRWGRAAALRHFAGFSTLAFSWLGVMVSDGLLVTGSARV